MFDRSVTYPCAAASYDDEGVDDPQVELAQLLEAGIVREPALPRRPHHRRRCTSIVHEVAREAAGVAPSFRATAWWVTDEGLELRELAGAVDGRSGFYWSKLHTILEALPVGRWTTTATWLGRSAPPHNRWANT